MKLPKIQYFDLGLRSENIEFLKSQICTFNDFLEGRHFQDSIFSLQVEQSKVMKSKKIPYGQ